MIQDAVVKAESRKDVTERYTSDDLADNGDYTTGGELTFLAGYIDLGAYKEIEVVSGVIKAFRG